MIEHKLSFPLPAPWENGLYKTERFGAINYLVGPNGSGKTRFAEVLKINLPNSRLLGTDRLRGMTKNESLGFLSDNFRHGFQKSNFQNMKNAGRDYGSGIDTFVLLDERPDIRVLVEATLNHLFDRKISLEWDSGNLIPKATLGSNTTSYRIDRDECHGIKELMILLAHLYNDQHHYLIIDEPELNLHPQFQAFFMQEVRKVAGKPVPEARKKVVFLITHSPFIVDIRNIDDLRSVISFDLKGSIPKTLEDLDANTEKHFTSLIPRINTHHKQLFFSDNPVFVEGILDAQIIECIQQYRNESTIAAGSCIIDAGGCEEVNQYLRLCQDLGKNAYFLYDLDSLFTGNLRQCIKSDNKVSAFLARLGLGNNFAKYCGALDQKLTELIYMIHTSCSEKMEDLKSYLDNLVKDNKFEGSNLQKARVAVLVEIALSKEIISEATSEDLVLDIQGHLNTIIDTLQQFNIILLPGGVLEHYLPKYTGSRYKLNDDAKRKAVENEIRYLESNMGIDLKDRYKELFHGIRQLPSKPPVDIKAALMKYLSDYIHKLKQLVISNSEWSSDEFNSYFANDSSGLGKLFKVKNLNHTGPGKFEANISVFGAVGAWTTKINDETNEGMLRFSLTDQYDQIK